MKTLIDFIFGCGLFFNAFLFIPQAYRIWKNKSAKGVSLFTFVGFNIMQLFTAWHALYEQDYLLMIGFILAFLTCGAVTALVFKYRES